MNKVTYAVVVGALILGLGIIMSKQPSEGLKPEGALSGQNVEVREGVQYITITARGGYSPRVSTAQANIPTKLIVRTNGTYDCSSALVIRSIGYQKILPQTGEEVIDLGVPERGTIQGLCSMGMYNFKIDFE